MSTNLTEQEVKAIADKAEEKYSYPNRDFCLDRKDYETTCALVDLKRLVYIAGATEYSLTAKALAEALENIRIEAINNGDRHGFQIEVHNMAKQALTLYNQNIKQ